MTGYWLLAPEYLLAAAALVALFGDLLPGGQKTTARIGALAAALACALALIAGTARPLFGGALAFDAISVFARVALTAMTAVYLLWLSARGMSPERSQEAVALVLFSVTGGMLMAGARDLVALYIAVELSTMPAYVLMGYRRDDERSLEGALKYFLLSVTTSLMMLYGFSFLFGITGTTRMFSLDLSGAGTLGTLAAVLSFVGLFAKLSAAPFHYWAPDAYEGAPAASGAFVSTLPKVAGIVALARLASALMPSVPGLWMLFAAVSLVSMLLGNLAAYPQDDIRRLMAYSGVAHTGYALLAVSTGSIGGFAAAVFYMVAYAMPSMAIMLIAAEEGCSLGDLGGLVARRPALAWMSAVLLLSLVGIPPMLGFFGKLYLFSAALDAGYVTLAVIAVSMSVVSAGYYFRIMRAVFFGEAPEGPLVRVRPSKTASTALTLLAAGTLLLGIFSSPILGFIGLGF